MQTEKQRERLVELLKKADESASNKMITDYEDAIRDNADYLLANNVVVLPLKVGSTIYRIDPVFKKIIDWTIARIDIYEDEVVYCDDCFNVFTDEEFGVEGGVYLTREDAENALKEREKAK